MVNFRKHAMTLLGQEIMSDVKPFEGHEALVDVQPNGRVRGIYVQPGDPDLFKHVSQWVATQLQIVLADERTWTGDEPGPFGASQVSYRVEGDRVVRTRVAYTKIDAVPGDAARTASKALEGETRATLDASGHLAALETDETLLVKTTDGKELMHGTLHLRAKLADAGAFDATGIPVAGSETRMPGQVVVSAGLADRMLEQRADGLTIEDIVHDLLTYGDGGSVPDMNRWLWRASGLLKLHPELAEKLIAPYAKLKLNGRGLTLDLLAAAGNGRYQSVMRQLLANRKVGTSDEYGQLLQRISLLKQPEPETAAFAWKTYQDGRSANDRDLGYASAFTVGSTARHLDDADLARRYNRQLGDELRNARDAEERAMLLRALGNAGSNDNVPTMAAAAHDEDEDVRRAAAVGLRLTDTPESNTALIKLTADPSAAVQSSAMAALDQHALSPADFTALSEIVLAGATNEVNDQTLITLLLHHLDGGAPVTQMLQFVANRSSDSRVRARIASALG
jgi:hypothetical protein